MVKKEHNINFTFDALPFSLIFSVYIDEYADWLLKF